LTREFFYRKDRQLDFKWLLNLKEKNDSFKLKIADYHILDDVNRIKSSTHAKLVISDYNSAYIGSGEFRKNSLLANFEVGCLVEGPQVFGICEVFDLMFKNSRRII